MTIEAIAEQAKFDYLMSVCVVDESGDNVFENLESYIDQIDSKMCADCASTMVKILYGVDTNAIDHTSECDWLKKHGFMDTDGRLRDGDRFIDLLGRKVDEFGRLVNDQNELVDIDGNLVDEDGNLLVQPQPFLDEDGNPVKEVVEVS